MSFITKRERVFNEYDLFDLPARNEGKLKTYASCTDARAWSHFRSDKTEHLVEIIKRNNETVRPKYVPTDVIVNTLLSAKNAEITRLRHKIDEFEQMLAAYDQLDLTCDQKCDIANAHAAIKAANKELDEMCLDLDLSGYTECIDSEAFETGKSRGDEPTKYTDEVEKSKGKEWVFEKEPTVKTETKSNQIVSCVCEVSTSAYDSRIDEMQETIIQKDAKLSAMRNTIAVMEINVCEPYYIYADIYTALEKILCTLSQNIKYKQYLDLLTSGRDIRYIEMTGKILFKIKVLEKFCLALIAPCTQDLKSIEPECTCCRTEMVTHVETTFALTSAESKKPSLDNERAQLVADIMQHQEMGEILSKDNLSLRIDDEPSDDCYNIDNCSIDAENVHRLKKLQSNYEDLLICYEKLKYERDGLFLQSVKYTNLENECECLQNKFKEYNQLWKDKEYHRKRSEDLDKLKEKYYILSEETLDIETKLKAELEINKIKSETVDELRSENIRLEKKITEISLMFEKQKNNLVCKVKECDCKIMCQEQQIKSLSQQIDNILEQESHKVSTTEDDSRSLQLMDEIESQKEQINNLKEAICCNEEEKQYFQEDFDSKLQLMNELKFDVEDWKGKYETATQKNCYLEQYLQEFEQHVNKLQNKNAELDKEIEMKSNAIENLNNILYFKSQENDNLLDQVDQKQNENKELLKKITNIENHLNSSLISLENEKKNTLSTIRLAKQESLEVLNNINNLRLHDLKPKSLETNSQKSKNIEDANNSYTETKDILNTDNVNDSLLNEIQELREVNFESINTLQEENISIKKSLDLVNRNSSILEFKLKDYENLRNNLNKLQNDNAKLLFENKRLEQDLSIKKDKIDEMLHIVELTKKNSDGLLEQLNESEHLQEDNAKLILENKRLQQDLATKKDKINEMLHTVELTKKNSDSLLEQLNESEHLQEDNAKLILENKRLKQDLATKKDKINEMLHTVEITKKNSESLIEQLNESKHLQEEYTKLDKTYQNLIDDKKCLEEKNINKDHRIEELVQNLSDLKKENDRISLETVHLKSIEYQLHGLHEKYAKLLEDKIKLQENYDNKTEESNNLYNNLENKIVENQDLYNQIKILQLRETSTNNNITALKNDNYNIHTNFQALKLESAALLEKLKQYEPLENQLNELKAAYQQIILEKEQLQHDLHEQLRNLHKMVQQNSHLSNESRELLAHSEVLENSLMQARDKTRNNNLSIDKNYDVIKKEIAKLKEEKLSQRQGIENLLDKIEDLEYLINSLNEDIIARDKKITTLENHINELEDEIRKLHSNLENVVETGEEVRQLSFEKMDQSLKSIEAHQSKATHNMRIEITNLQDKKALLENQLSNTKLRTEETIKDKYKFIAQIKHLQNERQIMISDIKQLELKSIGDSNLTPNSKINDIVTSLARISKCMDNKNTTLEKTLLSVQASYELLKSKADEAKLLAEEERQKNVDEKEAAKIARMHMESQIEYLESQLKEEKSDCENLIKDMEREMLNQTLISEKIVQSKEDEIGKLKSDLNIFQNKVKDLKEDTESGKIKFKEIINSLKLTVEENKKENLRLQKHFKNLNNKEVSDVEIHTICLERHEDIYTQTDHNDTSTPQKEILASLIGNKAHKNTMYILPVPDDSKGKSVMKSDITPTDTPTSINDVQILTALIDPNIDFLKNHYVNYKIKRLSLSKVEHSSINEVLNERHQEPTSPHLPFISSNDNFIGIYNTTTLTKLIKDKVSNRSSNANSSNKIFETTKSSITGILQTKETNKTFHEKNDFELPNTLIDPVKQQVDKDFFVIYTDTESMYDYQSGNKTYSPISYNLEFDNEATTLYETGKHAINTRKIAKQRSYSISKSDYEDRDDDSLKPKLDINLPMVTGGSHSTRTSLVDRKSLDSYAKAIYVTPSRVVYSDKNISSNNNNAHQNLLSLQSRLKLVFKERAEEKIPKSNRKDLHGNLENSKEQNEKQQDEKKISSKEAHHKLMTTGANIVSKNVESYLRDHSDEYNVESNNGLQYILSAMQDELDTNNIQHFHTNRPLYKSYSDQQLNISSSSRNYHLSLSNLSSVENITMSPKNHHKSVRDNAVLAKLDTIEDYVIKIEHLTRALKNIKIDYKKKIEAVKTQYDSNVKSIINEHNQGVASIQSLHEETLHDIVNIHENEIENLRSMSIEAMRKVEKLEKENQLLKLKLQEHIKEKEDEEPIKIKSPEIKAKKYKLRVKEKMLTKTNVEEYNIRPKRRSHGPCTCSLDMNTSETIRNIFEQVDVEQRKIAEKTYTKYIANKILGGNVESLDAQELSFLHLKVCRTWKTKLNKEEALQKRIDCLENELIKKQRQTQQHMAELDRKVAEEWQRLQEVREAVCRSPPWTRDSPPPPPPQRPCTTKKEICNCNSVSCNITLGERRSAGDLQPRMSRTGPKVKRGKTESNRAVLAKLDAEEGRQKKLLNDETPTRLKRSHDRQHLRNNKKRDT